MSTFNKPLFSATLFSIIIYWERIKKIVAKIMTCIFSKSQSLRGFGLTNSAQLYLHMNRSSIENKVLCFTLMTYSPDVNFQIRRIIQEILVKHKREKTLNTQYQLLLCGQICMSACTFGLSIVDACIPLQKVFCVVNTF